MTIAETITTELQNIITDISTKTGLVNDMSEWSKSDAGFGNYCYELNINGHDLMVIGTGSGFDAIVMSYMLPQELRTDACECRVTFNTRSQARLFCFTIEGQLKAK